MQTGAIRIDAASTQAPFEQVKQQVREQVDAGVLTPGDRLPPVRSLAGELDLAPNTVARAYRELEQEGVVVTRGRAGTFVADDEAGRATRTAVLTYLQQMRGLGLGGDEALEMVRRALADQAGRGPSSAP